MEIRVVMLKIILIPHMSYKENISLLNITYIKPMSVIHNDFEDHYFLSSMHYKIRIRTL